VDFPALFLGPARCNNEGRKRGYAVVSLVFSLLFLVMGFFFLFVAAWAAYGVYRMLRSNQRSRLYLAAAKEDQPLRVDHLSRRLARLVEDTRLLRISLEAPIRDVNDLRRGEFAQSAGEDVEVIDTTLMNVSRQLADWVQTVETLDAHDRDTLVSVGLSADTVRAALDAEGGAFERRNLHPVGRPPLDQRLGGIVAELTRFERSLQATAQPYR
jgi:hypothetical protein